MSEFESNKQDPKWKRFEKLTAKMQKDLSPEATVKHNDRILGKNTNSLRQVDVSVRKRIGQYEILIVISCKDLSRPVDVTDVEEFIALAEDVQANKAAIVSSKGFSKTSKTLAQNKGIDLYTLVDAESNDWNTFASVPIIASITGLEYAMLEFKPRFKPSCNPVEIKLYDKNGNALYTIDELLKKKWNQDPLLKNPGIHNGIKLTEGPLFLKRDNKFCPTEILADIVTVEKRYFGYIPAIKLQAFKDEKHGGFLRTSDMRLEPMSLMEVARKWKRLDNNEKLAVTPLFKTTSGKYISLEFGFTKTYKVKGVLPQNAVEKINFKIRI